MTPAAKCPRCPDFRKITGQVGDTCPLCGSTLVEAKGKNDK